jgi:hypothetical protein
MSEFNIVNADGAIRRVNEAENTDCTSFNPFFRSRD